jgi:hypothetical protein
MNPGTTTEPLALIVVAPRNDLQKVALMAQFQTIVKTIEPEACRVNVFGQFPCADDSIQIGNRPADPAMT